jgi:hypothetical protein
VVSRGGEHRADAVLVGNVHAEGECVARSTARRSPRRARRRGRRCTPWRPRREHDRGLSAHAAARSVMTQIFPSNLPMCSALRRDEDALDLRVALERV